MLTFGFENSTKVNILGIFFMKKSNRKEAYCDLLFFKAIAKESLLKRNHFFYLFRIVFCYPNRATNSNALSMVNDRMLN